MTRARPGRPPASTQRPGRGIPLRMLVVLGALSAFGPLSMDLYLPALPQLTTDLRTSTATAQLTMSACVVGLALGQLLLGPVSDRFGRRRPLLVGVATYAAASALCALAPDVGTLIGLRLLQGVAGGAGIVIARAVVRDLYEGDAAARVFSLLVLVTGIAPVLAPVLGGQLLRVTPWPGLFAVLSVVGCLLLVGALWAVPESLPPSARADGGLRATGRQFTTVLRDARFVGYTGVLALVTCLLFAYISMSSFVLQDDFGLTAQQFSYVFAGNAVVLVAVGRLGAALVRRRGAAATLRIGLLTCLLFGSALLAATLIGLGLPVVLPLLTMAVPGVMLVMPCATSLGMDRHGPRAGTASGVMGLAQFGLAGIVGPLVSINGTTPVLMASTMVVSVALAALVERLAARTRTVAEVPAG